MAKVLLIHSSRYGQTKKISEFLVNRLKQSGHQADLRDPASLDQVDSLDNYDALIIGAPVYKSRFDAKLERWVKAHNKEIRLKPSAFFSVCLGILQKDPKVQSEERIIVERFLQDTGWRPDAVTIVAGALPYTRYGWFTRQTMRWISSKAGGDVDTSRDFEYTDWAKVESWISDFSRDLTLRRRPVRPRFEVVLP